MSDAMYGGAAYAIGYYLKWTGSAYALRKPDDSADATSPTDAVILITDLLESTSLQPQSDGTFKGAFNHYQVNTQSVAFLNKFAKRTGSGGGGSGAPTPPDMYNERGIKALSGTLAAASNQPNVLFISGGALDDAGDNRLYHAFGGICDLGSGTIEQTAGGWYKPVINVNSITAKADIVIPQGLLPAEIFGTVPAGQRTILSGEDYLRELVPRGTRTTT